MQKYLTFDQMDDGKLEACIAFIRMIAERRNFEDVCRQNYKDTEEIFGIIVEDSFEEYMAAEQKDVDYLISSDESFECFIRDARRLLTP